MSPVGHATQFVQAIGRHEPDSKIARIRNSHILLYAILSLHSRSDNAHHK